MVINVDGAFTSPRNPLHNISNGSTANPPIPMKNPFTNSVRNPYARPPSTKSSSTPFSPPKMTNTASTKASLQLPPEKLTSNKADKTAARPKTALDVVIENSNDGGMFFDGFKYTKHYANKRSTTYRCSIL